jgi:hypothetical protein
MAMIANNPKVNPRFDGIRLGNNRVGTPLLKAIARIARTMTECTKKEA